MVYTLTVYTYGVLDRFAGFEWDVHNVRHIALHGVSPADVEDAVTNRNVVIPAGPGKTGKRWKLFGRTAAGRYLVDCVHRPAREVSDSDGVYDESIGKETLCPGN